MLKGKKILLGVTGSIAAFKAPLLIRLLIKEGAQVKTVMTPCAREFVTPLTLSTLSRNPVYCDFFENPSDKTEGKYFVGHIELSEWADYLVIAPATANTIGCFAHGLCSNLLHAVYLSARCPVFLAPAMDAEMFRHKSVRENIAKLQSAGNIIIPPEKGELASGMEGMGRMAEPETILSCLNKKKTLILKGKKCLVTAGPTYEFIDPVRYIGNPSTGKMGFAIAEELTDRGGEVTLVCGPASKPRNLNVADCINVTSSDEMYRQCMKSFPGSDITVMAAAVSDFVPEEYSENKIKKTGKPLLLKLSPARDILAAMGQKKKKGQFLAGFALETENGLPNALGKLREKNLDMVILNTPSGNGTGFAWDTNQVTIILPAKGGSLPTGRQASSGGKTKKVKKYPLKDKTKVAEDIADEICRQVAAGNRE